MQTPPLPVSLKLHQAPGLIPLLTLPPSRQAVNAHDWQHSTPAGAASLSRKRTRYIFQTRAYQHAGTTKPVLVQSNEAAQRRLQFCESTLVRAPSRHFSAHILRSATSLLCTGTNSLLYHQNSITEAEFISLRWRYQSSPRVTV
jgi:hypothetical protein